MGFLFMNMVRINNIYFVNICLLGSAMSFVTPFKFIKTMNTLKLDGGCNQHFITMI